MRKKSTPSKHWIIVLIILVSGYAIYSFTSDKFKPSQWTYQDGQSIIEQCMEDAGKMSKEYPKLTEDYCRCAMDKIRKKFSKNEYNDILQLSLRDQSPILLPVFQDCLNDYKKRIEEVHRHSPTGEVRP